MSYYRAPFLDAEPGTGLTIQEFVHLKHLCAEHGPGQRDGEKRYVGCDVCLPLPIAWWFTWDAKAGEWVK